MPRRRLREFYRREAVEFWSHVVEERPLLPFLIPLVILAWALERWIVHFSNWVPLAVAVWAMIQRGKLQRQALVEDLNMKWRQLISENLPRTPLEPCEWLNKLLMDIWPNFIEPKLSLKFSSIVELAVSTVKELVGFLKKRRLKHRKPRLIESIKLEDFSLGSCPPSMGLQGIQWSTSGNQRIMHIGFNWDTNDMGIVLFVKFGKTLGTARIVINSLHIKGDLLLMPILDGQAILYSFESTPEVKINVVFGSGGSQALPSTEFPGVSTWLVKILTDTIVKTMVEPRRRCFSLPPTNLGKYAVAGLLSVTVVSANKLLGIKGSLSDKGSKFRISSSVGDSDSKQIKTFIELELEELTRRTDVKQGPDPIWDETFNLAMHDDAGILKFHLHEWSLDNVKYDYLASCEIKVRYSEDDSSIFWAIGHGSSILAKRVEQCGKEVEMIVPFEGNKQGELTVRLVIKEWLYGPPSWNKSHPISPQQSIDDKTNFQPRTGRKLSITVVEGQNLSVPKSGKCDPYVKLQYGKATHRTKTISNNASNPAWNQKFVFDEIEGEYLKIKCYSADTFTDDHIGSAHCNLEGLVEGSVRDVWIPLEKVHTGELRIQIQAVRSDDVEVLRNSKSGEGSGLVELVLVEARDLVAADLSGTSDPFVVVQYGNTKKRTKVIYKTLNPEWNQTLEFPDNGSKLILHVKDHNAVLPTSSIGDCEVEYQALPPNQTADKWIPLQGVKKGEIHILVTRRFPELEKKPNAVSKNSASSKARKISEQMRESMRKSRESIEDGNIDGFELAFNELENVENIQEDYILQLEREKSLLLNKISKLDQEMSRSMSASIISK